MKKATIYRKQQRRAGNKTRTQRRSAFIPAIEAAPAGSDHFIPAIQRKCSTCREDDQLQRKENGSNSFFAPVRVKNYIQTLDNSGSKLSASANQFFSPHFNHDFSNVKIHTGKEAAASANDINAQAYTTGNHIVFNEGKYQPETNEGKKLLAHELTHVVQQSKSVQPRLIQRALITHPTLANPNFVFEAEKKLYTFSDLAKLYGSTDTAIAAANPKLKADKIKVGDLITIPAGNYPAGVTAASGAPQPGIVVSTGTNAIDMRWNSGAGSNKIGTLVRGKSLQVVSNGCWVNIADFSTRASGIIAELTILGLATSTAVFGHIDAANQRLASATVSTADQDLLARMIWGEQRGQGYDAMVAAAWIAMNRYKGGWGNFSQILTISQFHGIASASQVTGLTGSNASTWADAQTIAAGVIGGTIADTTSGFKFFGNRAAVKASMTACAKSNTAFIWHNISGTNFYYSNGDYTSSKCSVE